ncbi:unnamed protein product [Closterium sp. NIES-54]
MKALMALLRGDLDPWSTRSARRKCRCTLAHLLHLLLFFLCILGLLSPIHKGRLTCGGAAAAQLQAHRRSSHPCLRCPLRPCPPAALSWPCLLPPITGPSRPVPAHCRPSPARSRPLLARRCSFASAAAADVSVPKDVGAALTSAKHRNSKVKGGRGSGGGSGGGGGGSGSSSGGSGRGGGGGGGGGGSGAEVEALVAAVEATEGVAAVEAVGPVVVGLDLSVEALVVVGASSSSVGARPRRPSSSVSGCAEGDYYWCVPPDPGIAAAALGASASGTPPGTAPTEALHTFMLDSGASRCFFRDSTTLTPLLAPVPVRLADPSRGPVVASSSSVLPCPADAMVTTTTPEGQRVSICTCTRTRRHLATFTRRPGSSLYTLATEPSQVAASAQVSASSQVAASCSCRLLSHQTLLWNHHLGHPSLPRLRGMHSHLLVSGLPRSLPPLLPSPAPPYLPCVEGRQRAAPHSSSFPPMTAPLQTLHMDVWGPARVCGQGREHYFQLVVDDYTRYTTVFPLRSKCEVSAVLIPWIRTVRLRFGQDLPVLRLHSDRGGEFSSALLRDFCRGEGITQSFALPNSPQQNGIAERRIGLVMEVARTSMIHATAPHFLWPFPVRYTAHQLNLWPRVSLQETSPTLRWTGKVGDASVFRFYHPISRRVLPSQDVTFDESVPFYCLFPYRSAPPPPPPLFLSPGPPPVDPLLPQGPAPSGVSQVDPLPGTAPIQVAIISGAAPGASFGGVAFWGAASGGAEPGGAGSVGAGSGGAEPDGVEPGGVESEGAEPGGAESEGAESGGAEPLGASSPPLSSQQLRQWLVQRAHRWSGTPGAGEPGDTGAGGAGVTTGAGDPTEPGAGGARGAGAGVAGVGGPGAGGAEATGAGAVDHGAGGAGGIVRPRPYFVPLLQQSGSLTVHCEPPSRPVLPVRIARRTLRSRPPPVPGTHTMALRPSSVPLRVPLPPPPESSLPEVPDPESDRARPATPTVARLLATAVTDPSFDPPSVGGECALGTNVLEDRQEAFECLAASVPRFASLLLAPKGDPDAPDIPTPRSYAEAITGTYVDEVLPPGANIVSGMWIFRVKRPAGSPPAFKARYVARGFSQRQGVDYFQTLSPTPKMTTLWVLLHVATQRDYELHSLDFSTAFLQGSLHKEIWLRRPPGFTETLPAGTQWSLRPPVYGLHQAPRKWHDTLRTTLAALGFAPSTADPSLFLRTDTSLLLFYVLVHLLSAPPLDESVELSGSYPKLVGCLMYLMMCTRPDLAYRLSLLARYVAPGRHQKLHWDATKRVLRYLCSTSGMGLVLGGQGPVVLTGHADASWVDDSATQRSSQGYTFSLGATLVTYLLTDLGDQPRSPPVLYVDNKAMIALCQEHRLEHRTKHIALRYFLARELQRRGQLRLVYVATRANTADVFTKALLPGAFLPVIGVGNAKVMGANGGLVGLGNVLLVEGLSANLLSVRRLQKSKAKVTFGPTSYRAKLGKLLLWDLEEKSSCIKDLWQLPIISWNGKPPATAAAAATAKATTGGEETAPTDGALDAVKKVQQTQQPHGEVLAGVDATAAWAKASSRSGEADWETWHERLCHVNFPMLQKLVKDGSLKGLEVKGAVKEIGSCPTCLEIKFTKFPFSSSLGPAKAPLALMHMDVVGSTRAPSLLGSHYFLTIVDDHTQWTQGEGAEPEGAELGGAESEGAEPGGADS